MRCFPCLIVFSLVVTACEVHAQTTRADSAASYTYRGNDWLTLVKRANEPRLLTAFIYRVFQALGCDLKKRPQVNSVPLKLQGSDL